MHSCRCRHINSLLIFLQKDLDNKSSFANIYDVNHNHIYVDLPNFVNVAMYCYMHFNMYFSILHEFLNVCNVTEPNRGLTSPVSRDRRQALA